MPELRQHVGLLVNHACNKFGMRGQYFAETELRIDIGRGRLPDGEVERRQAERRMAALLQEEITRLLMDKDFRERLNEALGIGDDFELRLAAHVRKSRIDQRADTP